MVDYVTDAKIIELIDSIYGTVSGEVSWNDVLEQMYQVLPFSSVIMHGYDRELKQCRLETAGLFDPAFVHSYMEHYHTISPWIGAHEAQPVGAVYTTDQVDINLPRDHGEFFTDWVSPAGKGSAAAIKIFGQPHCYETINIDYPFGTDDKYNHVVARMLETLRPHLQRALDIKRNLDILSGAQSKFHSMLQQLHTPALLLTADGQVEWMNTIATDAVRQKRGIRLDCKGKLLLDCATDCDRLAKLVHDASIRSGDDLLTHLGTFAFHAKSELQEPNLISVTPVHDKLHGSDAHLARFHTPGWRCVVIIRYRADTPILPTEQLQMTLGLSQAEARVIQALCQDMNTDEIAAHLGLKPNTVRNQIKRALLRTGCRRQSELVRLATYSLTSL